MGDTTTHDGAGRRTSLDLLDDEFLARQDLVAAALDEGRVDDAQRIYEDAAALVVDDADGYRWHISAPTYRELKPLYRYRYTYRRGLEGPLDRDPVAPRGRFVDAASLARTYANRVREGGFLRWLVLWSEPIGYTAAIAVAVGLWFLLGDLIGDLAEIAVFSLIVLAAAGLWAATAWLGGIRFREAERLSVATRLAAIGVTGWIPWVATIGFEDMSGEPRIALSAATVLVLSVWVFRAHRGVLEFLAAVAAWMALVPSTSAWIADVISTDPNLDAVGVSSLVGAAAVAFPAVTMHGERRWIPGVMLALAALACLGMIAFSEDSFGAVGNTIGIILGTIAALSCWWSRRWIHERLRGVHLWSAIAIAAVTAIVALAVGPWDVLWEWLEDVPLPVVLVVVGSIVLVAIAAAIRTAVRRTEGSDG